MKYAVFIGWQKGLEDIPSFPLFNVVWPGNENDGSTVDKATLNSLGIEVPEYPAEVI